MARRLITVFEYDSATFDEPLSTTDIKALNTAIEDLSRHSHGEVLAPLYNKMGQLVGVSARQFVGVIQVSRSLTIQVLPKMSASADKTTASTESIQNLLFMLAYCGKLHTPHTSASQLKTFRGDFYEVLIYLFASSLLQEIRGSLHHEYVAFEQNLPYLRGKLLFSQHILANSAAEDKFYVSSDEFTPDNKLNQVFKYVAETLLTLTQDRQNKQLLGELHLMFDEVSWRPCSFADANSIHLSRLNSRFGPALELAKLFLSSRSLQLQADTFTSMTFLINMNTLFEEFVAQLLKRYCPPDLQVFPQGPRRHLVTALGPPDEIPQPTKRFELRPDISLLRGQEVEQIIDTKYKILNEEERKLGISQADLYQMYAYANKYHTSQITLLYPKRSGQEVPETIYTLDESCKVRIATINLQRNLKGSLSTIAADLLESLNLTNYLKSATYN